MMFSTIKLVSAHLLHPNLASHLMNLCWPTHLKHEGQKEPKTDESFEAPITQLTENVFTLLIAPQHLPGTKNN